MSGAFRIKGHQLENSTQVLYNVHSPTQCEGRPCPIHNPSDHHMRSWPQHWRDDRRMMERICPHGVGHPDPDDINPDHEHGCDGCCMPPNDKWYHDFLMNSKLVKDNSGPNYPEDPHKYTFEYTQYDKGRK